MIRIGSDSGDLAAESFHCDLTEQKVISMNDEIKEGRRASFDYHYLSLFKMYPVVVKHGNEKSTMDAFPAKTSIQFGDFPLPHLMTSEGIWKVTVAPDLSSADLADGLIVWLTIRSLYEDNKKEQPEWQGNFESPTLCCKVCVLDVVLKNHYFIIGRFPLKPHSEHHPDWFFIKWQGWFTKHFRWRSLKYMAMDNK